MKLLIASDIHGSADFCRQLLNAADRENATKILLLGDILYHGPRNNLPSEYAPKEVAAMLNAVKEKLICVFCFFYVEKIYKILHDLFLLFFVSKCILQQKAKHVNNRLPIVVICCVKEW